MGVSLASILLLAGALAAPAAAGAAGTPWPGWAPETIAADGARGLATTPQVQVAPDGSPVAAWIDVDGAVEVASRDPVGHWHARGVGRAWVLLADPSNKGVGLAAFIDRRFALQADPAGRLVVVWGGCSTDPGLRCVMRAADPVNSTYFFCDTCPLLAKALEPDGSWSPTAPPQQDAFHDLPQPPTPAGGGWNFAWYPAANVAGSIVALGTSQQVGETSILIARGDSSGVFAPPVRVALPFRCAPVYFGVVASLVDAAGNGVFAGTCSLAERPPKGRPVPDAVFVFVPAQGAATATAMPGVAAPWSSALAALEGGGGIVLLHADAGSSRVLEWDADGKVTATGVQLASPGADAFVRVAADGRAIAASGEWAAIRDAHGSWSAPFPLGFGVVAAAEGAGPPAPLGAQNDATSTVVALGTDTTPPAFATRPAIARSGLVAHLSASVDVRGAPLPAVRYAWRRCRTLKGPCSTIPGQTARRYRAHAASFVQLRVTAHSSSGTRSVSSPIIRVRR